VSDLHEFCEKLAKTLRDSRTIANLTQAKLAEKLGVTIVHVSKLENGHSLPSIELLRKYKAVTGRDPYCVTDEISQVKRRRQLEPVIERLSKEVQSD
jgi:transcriptional regulator with XRE-family HTH domain